MTGLYELLDRAAGRAECKVRGAAPAGFLDRCAAAGLPVLGAEAVGEDTLLVTLRQQDAARAELLALRACCELELLQCSGGRSMLHRLLRRGVPLTLFLLCFLTLVCSKLFIWELEVSGNETVSSAKILNALSECGVTIGTYWPGYTSDVLRSELLLKLPELAWATVQISGSHAEVVVRERVQKPEIYDADVPVDLAAHKSGFITRLQALNGTALVHRGSAVTAGETLIAGMTDSAFSGQRPCHALGSVEAETCCERSAVAPRTACVRDTTGRTHSRWALIVGKKRINFYRNSSICGDSCDKITQEWQCKVKGLFQLPLSLVREQVTPYTLTARFRDEQRACLAMEQQLHDELARAVEADGCILEEWFSRCRSGETLNVCLRARCREDIAEERPRIQEEYQ